jgi:hypothetical protein
MQSSRHAAHANPLASLRCLLVLLNLAGLLAVSAAEAHAQQQSTGLPLPGESHKSVATSQAAGSVTNADGASLNLASLDIADLVRTCERNGTEINQRWLNYTYRLKKILREFTDQGKAGDKQWQEFEAYPIRGQHILVQVFENGVPLPSAQVAWHRRRAGEDLERAEREAERQKQAGRAARDEPTGYPAAGVYVRVRHRLVAISIDPSTLLQASVLTAPRLEEADGRQCIVFDFHVRPDTVLPPRRTYLAHLVGRIWIDVADKVIARIEAWPTDELRKSDPPQTAKDEPRFVYQQTKLPSGMWAPALMRINSGGNPALFDGLNWDVAFEFTEYKQFTTSAEDPKVEPQKSDSN